MRKILLLSASLILIGAGCSSSTPAAENSTDNTQNTPVTQEQSAPATVQQQVVIPTPAVTQTNPKPTQAVTQPSTSPVVQPAPTTPTYTMAQVSVNNSESKCWSVVNGNVYDLTSYIPRHPGGKDKVLAICGKDGSSAFQDQHGGDEKPETMLSRLKIGILK